MAYESWGRLDTACSNAILLHHALTGDSHAAGPAGPGHVTPGWWDRFIGPGAPIDTDRFYVVCPNALGDCQGTTGPSSLAPDGRTFGSRFPSLTIRDQVRVEAALADWLGIRRWSAVIGGSMGGMRTIEWAVEFPERVGVAVALATGAAATAEQIAVSAQIRAIRLGPGFHDGDYYEQPPGRGPHRGMGIARWIGQVTYRSEAELQARFGREMQHGDPMERGLYAVESYLEHHAEKLAHRFDANTYVLFSEAMNDHDLGRGRGGVDQALSRIEARVVLVGIYSDRLYPIYLQHEIVEGLGDRSEMNVVPSIYGHDGFLIEWKQVEAFFAVRCPKRPSKPERPGV